MSRSQKKNRELTSLDTISFPFNLDLKTGHLVPVESIFDISSNVHGRHDDDLRESFRFVLKRSVTGMLNGMFRMLLGCQGHETVKGI